MNAHRSPSSQLRLFGVTVLLAGLFSVLLVGQASAFDVYKNVGYIPGMELSHPTRAAVDDATGNLLVVDSGHSKVQVWGPGGVSSSHILDFGSDELSRPYGIAIDQSNGDVYVSNAGADEVQSITLTGAEAGTYTLSFEGQTTGPIAYDDADGSGVQAALEALTNVGAGDVQVVGAGDPVFGSAYSVTFTGALTQTNVAQLVADGSGLTNAPDTTASVVIATSPQGGVDRIVRFQPDDRDNPTAYSVDPSFATPVKGSDATSGQVGSFTSPLAVDPADGDLLVGDTGNNYVERFDSNGAFVSAFNGADTTNGPFLHLQDLVVGGDTTYVLDVTEPYDSSTGVMPGTSRVEKFDSTGLSLGQQPAVDPDNQTKNQTKARNLTYGVASQSLLVSFQGTYTPPGRLRVYRGGNEYQVVDYLSGSEIFQSAVLGIAVDNGSPSASGRVYGVTTLGWLEVVGKEGVQVFDRLRYPDVTLDAASDVAGTTAHLSGTVDPLHGTQWSYRFEYCNGSQCQSTPLEEVTEAEPVTEADDPKTVEADLSDLAPNTTYEVRLIATNSDGEHGSEVETFTTVAVSPAAVTGGVSDRTEHGATLRGTVNPLGTQSSYHFEYGTTTSYGSRIPAAYEAVVGKGQSPVPVAQPIAGLQPGTTYHFRLVAQNAAGQDFGEDKTFVTPSGTETSRSYELVSPAEKGGNNVRAQVGMQASRDGNSFTYIGSNTLGGLSESSPFQPRYVAQRTPSGWVNRGTDPAQTEIRTGSGPLRVTWAVSEDGTKAVVGSLKALAPGAVEGDANVYLRDVSSGAMVTMATTPDLGWFRDNTYTQSNVYVTGTSNFDHVLILGKDTSFLPGVPSGAVYDFTGGELAVASRNASDIPVPGTGSGVYEHEKRVLSEDGARFVFGSSDGVYLRSGNTSIPLSASRRSSDPGTMQGAKIVGADRQLDTIYLFSQELTDDSLPGVVNLYRYDTETDELEMLTRVTDSPDVEALGGLQVSDDGGTVYFATHAELTGDTPSSGGQVPNIYVWRNNTLHYIATVDLSRDNGGIGGVQYFWASPNGRYIVLNLATKLGEYDSESPTCRDDVVGATIACLEAYRYDADTGELKCVSCPPDDRKAITSASIGLSYADSGTLSFVRAVNDKGQVFFDTPEQLVPGDVNSARDVYEYADETGPRLISTGHGGDAKLAEVSVDGSDVFFTTGDRLVNVDTDNSIDVYDARVGGGIPSQNLVTPNTECSGEGCRAGALPLTPPSSGSEAANGPRSGKGGKRCGKGRQLRTVKGKKRCVKRHKQNRANHNRRQGR